MSAFPPRAVAQNGDLAKAAGACRMARQQHGTWGGLNDRLPLKRTRYPQAGGQWRGRGLLEFKASEVLSNPCKDPPGFGRQRTSPDSSLKSSIKGDLIFFNPVVPKQKLPARGTQATQGNGTSKLCSSPRNSGGARAPPARHGAVPERCTCGHGEAVAAFSPPSLRTELPGTPQHRPTALARGLRPYNEARAKKR